MILLNFRTLLPFGLAGYNERPLTAGTVRDNRPNNIKCSPKPNQSQPNDINTGYKTEDLDGKDYITIQYVGIALGSGTTPPTVNDYKLQSFISEGLTYSNLNKEFVDNAFQIQMTVTNNSDTSIQISEIGLYGTDNSDGYPSFLFTRSVLSTPILLNTGDSQIVGIKIDFNKFIDSTL